MVAYAGKKEKCFFITMKWFTQKSIYPWNGKMTLILFKEKLMEQKNRILEDIADNILGCLKEKYSPR